ncbi:MAG: hypothetical protein JWM82_1745 [Myxococcales bacterium]|nr:hypothetical protein [Myxococcales bacterium]
MLRMTWTPKDWWRPTAVVPASLRVGFVCDCDRCAIDGQHNPLCEIHHEPPLPCDCARGEAPPRVIPAGAS